MNLHPYDGRERHYCHTDNPQAEGLAAVASLLRLDKPPPRDGLLYDLSFYSGGIGVLDRLAITLPAGPKLWGRVIEVFRAKTPEEAAEDAAWAEDFLWLLHEDEEPLPPRQAAVRFINSERRSFQAQCQSASRTLFQKESNVNDWVALWGDDTQLNYLGYSQG